jgi:outer membrane protein assembly factor BamD
MKIGFFHSIALLCLLLLATGCSNFQQLLKSNDVSKKYKAALEYYEQEEYYRASQLLDQVTDLMAGTEEAEKAQFFRAKAHFLQGNYILSDTYFRNFYTTYPRSPYAEEAMFLQAQSLYEQSPSYEEDQKPTITAIEAYEEFLVRYPTSERAERANKVLEELYTKLDRKDFNQARLYYKLRYWRSAAVALDVFLQEHASSPFAEEAAFLRLDAQYRFAQESVPDKQEERYDVALDYFQAFVDTYPESRYKREAERIFDGVQTALAAIRKTKQPNS